MKKIIKLALISCLVLTVCALGLSACDLSGGSHTHTVVVDEAVSPTCTEDGLTTGSHCSVCKEVIVEQKVVRAHGHTEVPDPAVAPTCTEEGLTRGSHCSVCGEIIVEQIVSDAFGHVEVTEPYVAPTCTKTGLTVGKYCSVCGDVIIEQTVIPANGHSFGEWLVTKEPTETEMGTKRRDCENCDAYETDVIVPDSHVHSNWPEISIPAVKPTCTKTGLTEGRKCSGCGEILVEQIVIPAKGHSYADTVTSPTCTEDGYTTHTCSCGHYYVDSYVDALGHKSVIDRAVAPTCTETGLTEGRHCSRCNLVTIEQEIISAKGHLYSLMKVPNEEGKCAIMCKNCDNIQEYVEVIKYEDYGAVGDGVTDDSDAIREAHNVANNFGLPVEGKAGATYYIGAISTTITVKTDTDWKGASFIFDDSTIRWNDSKLRGVNVFTIAPDTSAENVTVPTGYSLSKGQTNVGLTFDGPCLLKIENSNEKIYVRYGENANGGVNKNEIILVDENGNVDPSTPIQYDYSKVTKITKFSVEDKPIKVGNGKITTIAPNPKSYDPDYENNYCYFARGILIQRSNTTVYGVEHVVENEDMTVEIDRNGDGVIDKWGADKSYGVPYNGFFAFKQCYNATLSDCIVEGHQAYSFYQGTARNEMGSYDITANDCVNLSFYKVVQYENESTGETITNRFMYHGVMGSNFCRNVVMDECYLDRFDSHQGLHNARITNSTLGFGILVIGGGELYIENVYRISVGAFVHLRGDYNSVFDGDLIIKDCKMGSGIRTVINGTWRSFYNGLPNYVMRNITIDGLTVEGSIYTTIYLYDMSGASVGAVNDSVNKLYLPESVTVSGLKGTGLGWVSIKPSNKDDAFAAVEINEN